LYARNELGYLSFLAVAYEYIMMG